MKIVRMRYSFDPKINYDGLIACSQCYHRISIQHVVIHIDLGLNLYAKSEMNVCRQCFKELKKVFERDKASNNKRHSQQARKTKSA